jgi:Fe-S-cluster containining protein
MLLLQHEAARKEPFGYVCRACSQCCPHKYIQVNPYEVAHLAHFLNLSTTEFRAVFTEHDGAILKRDDNDACVFLAKSGCAVHPARPLVCRLYPLGRRVAADGSEEWVRADPHPNSQGAFTTDGTIADFVAAQGAQPFMEAADAYADWVRAAYAVVGDDANSETKAAITCTLLDMDAAIGAHCAKAHIKEPADIEQRRILHLRILYQILGGDHD